MSAPIEYSRYPMWLNHKKLDPVIVYDEAQEDEYRAKGFEAPGTADPHAYLVSKVSDKLDDAIRAMNARVESRIKDSLRDLYTKIVEMVQVEINNNRRNDFANKIVTAKIAGEFELASTRLAVDAMDAVREIAKSTRYDG